MAKLTKRKKAINELLKDKSECSLKEAVSIIKKSPATKFDQTIEIAMKLNIEQSTTPIRGTVTLPHGTGKTVKIAVFCKQDQQEEATKAGADFVGAEELIAKVKGGWCDFDVAVASPDMMRDMAMLGKVLGPRGLMPNPKTGTVTKEITKAVGELKAGKIEFRMDKQSGIKGPVGKLSFDEKKIIENIKTFIKSVIDSNIKLQKIQNVKSIAITSTMGPGIKIDKNEFKIS